MKIDKCRSCGAAIIWAKTAKNLKAIPLDAEPRADGQLALSAELTAVTVGSGPFIGFDDARYVSHFATCPNADKYRRKS